MQMKLYTEEQIRKAYLEGWNDGQHENIGYIDGVVQSLTTIELPSEVEIQNEAEIYDGLFYDFDFIEGAKWVIEQIKQQDNGK